MRHVVGTNVSKRARTTLLGNVAVLQPFGRPVVAAHNGHANKLVGDGLLAVFGAPLKLDDHADRALDAACVIQAKIDAHFRATLRAGSVSIRARSLWGNMGGGSKLDFTLIGDAVNVAFRVEALTRKTGGTILVSEATRESLRRADTLLASRGMEPIRGRSEPVSLHAVASRIPV